MEFIKNLVNNTILYYKNGLLKWINVDNKEILSYTKDDEDVKLKNWK